MAEGAVAAPFVLRARQTQAVSRVAGCVVETKGGRPEAVVWGGHSHRSRAGRTPRDPGDAADL